MDYHKGWNEHMSPEDSKNLAYWERNMLALFLAHIEFMISPGHSGWYFDEQNNWDGWKRVISIAKGAITFHIPDDFDVGDLPKIENNWNGHSTEEKWRRIAKACGVNLANINDKTGESFEPAR